MTSEFKSYLRASLLRQRGQNQELVKEVLENLSPRNIERLFRIIQTLEMERDNERSKRRRFQPYR